MKVKICTSLFLISVLALNFAAFGQKRKPVSKTNSKKVVWNYEYYAPSAPVKISTTTESLPVNYTGHDIVKLFENLNLLKNQASKTGKNDADFSAFIKNKKLLENLTSEDLFVFKKLPGDYRSARNSATDEILRAAFLELNENAEIYPQLDSDGGCGVGSGSGTGTLPVVSSKESLLDKISPSENLDELWKKVNFPIDSFLPVYNRKLYKGKFDKNEKYENCSFTYYLPSPQVFYQLAFDRKQPYQLVKISGIDLDVNDYEYKPKEKIGIVGWESDASKSIPYIDEYIAVKLAAPFVRTNKIVKFDPIEKKNFEANVNQIVVDIVGIWAVDQKTGKILSKEIGQKTID